MALLLGHLFVPKLYKGAWSSDKANHTCENMLYSYILLFAIQGVQNIFGKGNFLVSRSSDIKVYALENTVVSQSKKYTGHDMEFLCTFPLVYIGQLT